MPQATSDLTVEQFYCTRNQKLVEFQLQEEIAQDVSVSASNENTIEEPVKVGHRVGVKGVKDMEHRQLFDEAKVGDPYQQDFQTVYSVTFTISPFLAKRKEIWLVQDEAEARTTSLINMIERMGSVMPTSSIFSSSTQTSSSDGNIIVVKNSLSFFELLAFAGGVWYFFSQMLFGTLFRSFFLDDKVVFKISSHMQQDQLQA
mmetsp:Transcript_19488/g.33119  ORF Transcript_19488/g.33119 Transcript_19488/m.33119 type:complete len:202 (+) Transcript_19488:1533-2138(+)